MDAPPLVIRPEEITSLRISSLSEEIIQRLLKFDTLDVIGISSAMFFACSAVNMSKTIANVNVKSLALDYIAIPILGKFEGVFFTLSRAEGINFEEQIKQMDALLTKDGNSPEKTVVASKKDTTEKLTNLALWRLRSYPMIKILGAGGAINTAISVALQLTRTNIMREKAGITFAGLTSIPSNKEEAKMITAVDIFVEKGKETVYDEHHRQLVEKITKGTN